jgi:hypothetical protein
MSRRGCSLPANASGSDPHHASITSRVGQVSMFGASMVVGGKLAGTQIRLLGTRGHTTLSNICTIIAFVIFGQVIV